MIVRLGFSVFVFVCVLAFPGASTAQESQSNSSASSPVVDFGLADLADSAADARIAGEAFERFGGTLANVAVELADALARMSARFDPFGYKTAFQTLGRQSEIIQKQQALIFQLQSQQIELLRAENRRLRDQVEQAIQPRKGRRRGKEPSKRGQAPRDS